MTDVSVAADATADLGGAPLLDNAPNFSNDLGSQVEPATPKEKVSLDDAIDRAWSKAAESEAKPEPKESAKEAAKPAEKAEAKPAKPEKTEAKELAKPEAKTAPERGEDGKFVSNKPAEAKPAEQPKPASFTEAPPPARVAQDVKDTWHELPPRAREEWTRMHDEYQKGFEKYKQAADRDAGLNEFHEMAGKAGKELRNVVREYVEMENLLHSDAPRGIEAILNRLGTTPRQYAEMVLGQTPDQASHASERKILQLEQKIAQLERGVGTVQQTVEQQREQTIIDEVMRFASQEGHERFEELAKDIRILMEAGRAQTLSEAYELAERLNPAPKAPILETPAAHTPVIDEEAQTLKGRKSINGAPSAGSQPAAKKRAATLDEAIDRALARM